MKIKIIIIIVILIILLRKKENFYSDVISEQKYNIEFLVKDDNNNILFRAKKEEEINWDDIYNKNGYDDYYIFYPNGDVKVFYYLQYSKRILYGSVENKNNLINRLNINKNKQGPVTPKKATPNVKITNQ